MIDRSQTRRPLWVGALVAPWVGPSAFLIYGTLNSLTRHQPGGFGLWSEMAFAYYAFGLPISYVTMLVLGLPYLLWLRKRQILGWLTICLGATFSGSLVLGIAWTGDQMYKPLFVFAAVGAVLGLLSGITFCVVVGPNNSFKGKPLRGPKHPCGFLSGSP